jgi:hypothetical protein
MNEGVDPQMEERLAASPEVLAVKVEEEVVVFMMNAGKFLGLRGGAGLVWQKIEAGTDRESAIIEAIVAERTGDAAHIRADVAKAITEMKRSGILVAG